MKGLGCGSFKFGLLSAAMESVLMVNSTVAAVEKIPESRSALKYGCGEALKSERMFINGQSIAVVTLKK